MRFPSGLYRHVAACNTVAPGPWPPLVVDGRAAAWPSAAARAEMARLADDFADRGDHWTFAPGRDDFAARSAALERLCARLRAAGAIRAPRGETYAVVGEWGEAALAALDRGAAEAIGIRAFGVHLNGYVRRADGLHMWISRRARDKEVAPGKLDNMVAGGQPAGLGLLDNLVKECGEEASLPPALAHRATPVGLVRYCFSGARGLKPDTLFCYDLEVPDDVVPTPSDGESEGFELWHVERVLDTLAEGWAFKFNVPLVILDFALRHGVLTPENAAEYTAVASGLRRDFPRFGA
ncbi:Thiamine pyrophosphokinase [uncultured Alphaproteobacteria bacterium]|uniref:Thiamine pyrophosphokinase n=1 Tax=uncultured Alphaproteobacteria bacterium TaxID=91750 RepID=A0A212KI68_9PROT|nr:Thiamine pyrophosphokinase [uncultured Alphaproteobacteria bacterium]